MTNKRICFDMDGCLCSLYNVPNWLEYLVNEDTTPYEIAEPMVRMCSLAKRLNNLQKHGYEIAIVSWLSKCGSNEYNEAVTEAKKVWLAKHLPSVTWDEIIIIPYGTPKENYCRSADDILFDDESKNRESWTGKAFAETAIFEVLKNL